MQNKLKTVIQEVQHKKIDLKSLEKSVLDLVQDYGPLNYYDAIQLISEYYEDDFVIPNPVPLTNVNISTEYKVWTEISFTDSNDPVAALSFFIKDTSDTKTSYGKLCITPNGEVQLNYNKMKFVDGNDYANKNILKSNIKKLTCFKNLWKNANVATELIRLLEDLL